MTVGDLTLADGFSALNRSDLATAGEGTGCEGSRVFWAPKMAGRVSSMSQYQQAMDR